MAERIVPVVRFNGCDLPSGGYYNDGELRELVASYVPHIGEALSADEVSVINKGHGLSVRCGKVSLDMNWRNRRNMGYDTPEEIHWRLGLINALDELDTGLAYELDVMPEGLGIKLRLMVPGRYIQETTIDKLLTDVTKITKPLSN